MLHLSKTAGYALHALSCIGRAAPRSSVVRSIAQCTGLQKPYLSKIINQLVHHGLVHAKRGYRGGVTLARLPDEITLLDIVHAVDGNSATSCCLFGLDHCPVDGTCPAHVQWNAMREQVEAMLARITLSEVMQSPGCSPESPDRNLQICALIAKCG
jgi:Rrf2 family protein